MSTSIHITDNYRGNHVSFISTFPEDFDLDAGMFLTSTDHTPSAKLRYSIGTTDTSDTGAAIKFCMMLDNLSRRLGVRTNVSKVLLTNGHEHITMFNPRLTITENPHGIYLEIEGMQAKHSSGEEWEERWT